MRHRKYARKYTALAMAGGLVSLSLSPRIHAAVTIADWTFEKSLPSTWGSGVGATGTDVGPFSPDSGAGIGSASAHHASGLTLYSAPAGNGSSKSFNANFFAIGDYFQYNVDTTGSQQISLSFDMTHSSTGPGSFELAYTTVANPLATDFISLAAVTLPTASSNSWTSTTIDTNTQFSFNFPTAVENTPNFAVRLIDLVTPSGTGGTARMDNVVAAAGSVTVTWTGSGSDANWSTGANWTEPPPLSANLVFTGNSQLANNNDLSFSSISAITFDQNAGSFTLSGNSVNLSTGITNSSTNAQVINFGLNLVSPTNSQTFTAGANLTFNGPVSLGSNALTITGAGTTLFTGGISSTSGDIVKAGAGTLVFQGTSNVFGRLTISAGAVTLPAGSSIDTEIGAFATGLWATATLSGAGSLTVGLPFRLGATPNNGTFQLNANANGTAFTGPVTITGSGANNSTGGGGQLVVRSNQSPLGTGTLTVAASANGLAILADTESNGKLDNPIVLSGGDNNFTLFAGATFTSTGATPGPASLTLGPISGTGRVVVQVCAAPLSGPGTAPVAGGGGGIVNFQGASSYTGDTVFNLGSSGIVKNLADNALPTTTNLTFGANSGFGGIYDLNGHNQQIASLSSGGAALGQIIDNAAAPGTDTLTISGSNTATFSLPIIDLHHSGGRDIALVLPVANTGTQVLSGAVDIGGGATVNGGTLQATNSFNANLTIGPAGTFNFSGPVVSSTITNNGVLHQTSGNSTLGAITGNLSGAGVTTIDGSATADSVRQNTLNINGTLQLNQNGSNSIVVSNLNVGDNSFFTTGHLDLNDNDLIIPYTGTSPLSTIQFLVRLGYNFNAGGTWDGNGINSSAAHGNPMQNTALGVGEAKDLGITSLDGNPITGNAVIVKYTYIGDASLDGKVDLGNDMNLFLIGYLTPNASGWELGDFNYDGVVNNTDFGMLVNGLELQGTSLGQIDNFILASPLLSSAQKASLLTIVPEPSSVAVVALAACGAATYRRRRGTSKVHSTL